MGHACELCEFVGGLKGEPMPIDPTGFEPRSVSIILVIDPYFPPDIIDVIPNRIRQVVLLFMSHPECLSRAHKLV